MTAQLAARPSAAPVPSAWWTPPARCSASWAATGGSCCAGPRRAGAAASATRRPPQRAPRHLPGRLPDGRRQAHGDCPRCRSPPRRLPIGGSPRSVPSGRTVARSSTTSRQRLWRPSLGHRRGRTRDRALSPEAQTRADDARPGPATVPGPPAPQSSASTPVPTPDLLPSHCRQGVCRGSPHGPTWWSRWRSSWPRISC